MVEATNELEVTPFQRWIEITMRRLPQPVRLAFLLLVLPYLAWTLLTTICRPWTLIQAFVGLCVIVSVRWWMPLLLG